MTGKGADKKRQSQILLKKVVLADGYEKKNSREK